MERYGLFREHLFEVMGIMDLPLSHGGWDSSNTTRMAGILSDTGDLQRDCFCSVHVSLRGDKVLLRSLKA